MVDMKDVTNVYCSFVFPRVTSRPEFSLYLVPASHWGSVHLEHTISQLGAGMFLPG